MRICFSSSQMNAIGGFSARLNGFRRDHPSKMRRHQKQTNGLSGNSRTTDMKGAGLLPAPVAPQKKTPARRHSGWGFQRYRQPRAGGGQYIKATVGRVARHVPICRGELLSTLPSGRSALLSCKRKNPSQGERSGWGSRGVGCLVAVSRYSSTCARPCRPSSL